ncbi:hypothetical protein GLOIN_2v573345 [Rhizophagus clarus]|uniref:Uncharacterized protein n=1 Tax=Rhizophagus clarus TaxID=94130 RepID=A0A8H3R2P0_9GLOM|nr:hypothetical protein GLOIN_2v573345 [Rhizophagus clarus]
MITIDRKNNCCLFVPLKIGVNIILLIVFAVGLFEVTLYVRYLTYKSYRSSIEFVYIAYPTIVIYGLITIVAVFGLYVMTCADTLKMLTIYSKIFYGITGFNVLNSTVIIVETIALVVECAEYSYLCGRNQLKIIIPVHITSIILSLYFAMIISIYVRVRKDKYIQPVYF